MMIVMVVVVMMMWYVVVVAAAVVCKPTKELAPHDTSGLGLGLGYP